MAALPSTIATSPPDDGFKSVVNGLFKTGLQFLSDNLFGGEEEDRNTRLREQNAALIAAQQSAASPLGKGFGKDVGTLVLIGGVGLGAFLLIRSL